MLVDAHSVLRWVVLLAAVVALALPLLNAARGGLAGAVRTAVVAYTAVLTLQFLLGAVVWLAQGRWEGDDAFFSWIHPLAMVAAVGLAHAGTARLRRASGESERAASARRAALLLVAGSVALVLLAVPW